MTPYNPRKGDEVLIVKKGTVGAVGPDEFQVDDWFITLAELHHPSFKIMKL